MKDRIGYGKVLNEINIMKCFAPKGTAPEASALIAPDLLRLGFGLLVAFLSFLFNNKTIRCTLVRFAL